MPSIDCDIVRGDLYKCLEAVISTKSPKEILDGPSEEFPSECTALKVAFENCVKETNEKKTE